MRAAVLLVGDELLSGRTRDANLSELAMRLGDLGVEVKEARVVSDESGAIVGGLNELRGKYDVVFTTGGIGPTHDDITARCVAEAFGVELELNEEARGRMEKEYAARGLEMNEARLRMARVPVGAELISNEVSAAPGFRIGNVYVFAGVPMIMRSMMDEVAKGLAKRVGRRFTSRTLRTGLGEGDLADAVGEVAGEWEGRGVKVGSYPWFSEGRYGVRLVARGRDGGDVEGALGALKEAVEALGGEAKEER